MKKKDIKKSTILRDWKKLIIKKVPRDIKRDSQEVLRELRYGPIHS